MSLSHSPSQASAFLHTRRRPRQARSQVTVAAILEAAVRVLLKHGYHGFTTKEVAEVAGVGIGSLYEYFPNKEALIAAVVEREADRYMGILERELRAGFERPFARALSAALRAALSAAEPRRPLVSLLIRERPEIGQLATLGGQAVRAADLAALCLEQWGHEVHASSAATYCVLSNMLIGAYFSQVVAPTRQISGEAFLEAIEQILLKVLSPHGEPTHPPTIDAAV